MDLLAVEERQESPNTAYSNLPAYSEVEAISDRNKVLQHCFCMGWMLQEVVSWP